MMDNNNYPLYPAPDYALVELPKKYESGLTAEKEKYATNTSGILRNFVITTNSFTALDEVNEHFNKMVDKTVYFAQFEDGEAIKINDTEYVFVPVKSIRGAKEHAKA